MPPRPVMTPVWQRRLSKTALRRRTGVSLLPSISSIPSARPLHTTSTPQASSTTIASKRSSTLTKPDPSGPALSALLSRLSLPPSTDLHPALIACLTHPSYADPSFRLSLTPEEVEALKLNEIETNAILSNLGNSLLGMFVSEHLSTVYPLLPTESLKTALTAYVGPSACFSVARELGVGVQGGGNTGESGKGRGMNSAGIPVRWHRLDKSASRSIGEIEEATIEKIPVARGFQKMMKKREDGEGETELQGGERPWTERINFENVVASTVKAFVGLIYQQEGIHAARTFTHAHFLSRHLDLRKLFNFTNPKFVLSSVVTKHLAAAGVPPSLYQGKLDSRVLASTGTNSISPLFNVGIFLPSGIKLAEGQGSSLKMAEHRAAINALHSIFLVRGDQFSVPLSTSSASSSLTASGSGSARDIGEYGEGLPSGLYDTWGLSAGAVGGSERESTWVYPGGVGDVGGFEGVVGTAARKLRHSR